MLEVTCPDCAGTMSAQGEAPDYLWRCAGCRGVWLERAALKRAGADLPERMKRADEDRKLRCPLCEGAMRTVALPEVDVDLCTLCGGLYLDAGELQTLQRAYPRPGVALSPEEELALPSDLRAAFGDSPRRDSGGNLLETYESVAGVAEVLGSLFDLF